MQLECLSAKSKKLKFSSKRDFSPKLNANSAERHSYSINTVVLSMVKYAHI